MRLIGLSVTDLMGYMPTDHGLAHALPDTGTGFTLSNPDALGIHVADAPVFTDPAVLAAYVRGFIDHQVLTDDKEN